MENKCPVFIFGGIDIGEFEKIASEALALRNVNRVELAELLVQSIEVKEDDENKLAWINEIQRRDQDIRLGASVTKPAYEVLKEAREKLRCTK